MQIIRLFNCSSTALSQCERDNLFMFNEMYKAWRDTSGGSGNCGRECCPV